jgi:uncharacterized protein (DUF488 family)
MDRDDDTIFSIGHSNLTTEAFLALLKDAGIDAIADVRSMPWSRFNPQFNRETLKSSLKAAGIAYSYLGDALGGRPSEPRFFCEGVADYRKMAKADAFAEGLQRLKTGSRKYRIAILCAEQNPIGCHRCLLVGRALHSSRQKIVHLLHDGTALTQDDIEERLLAMAGVADNDLFSSAKDRLDDAYWAQNRKAAFADPDQDVSPSQNRSSLA